MTWAPLVYAYDIEGREYAVLQYNGYYDQRLTIGIPT